MTVALSHALHARSSVPSEDTHHIVAMNPETVPKYPHFRLKVDLSRFFHDARQYCWIFVDGTRVQRIDQIEQHIAKLFSILEPFHLLLNDTDYLPPTEDVRILEKNETILVVPGSGIDTPSMSVTLSDINVHSGLVKVEACNGSTYDKKDIQSNVQTFQTNISTTKAPNGRDVPNNSDTSAITTNNTTTDVMFYSMIDDAEADTDSKVMDNNFLENSNDIGNSIISGTKRKRVRKRRAKNLSQEHSFFMSPLATETKDSKLKKPKVVDNIIIPTAKHIRFDNMENNENSIAKKIVREVSDSYVARVSSSNDLSALLALGKSSTPMFVKKKIKKEVNVDASSASSDEMYNKSKENNVGTERNTCETGRKGYYKNIEIEKIPIMTRKPQVKDIIAFKTLKLGANYTPQLSEFIVTEVMDFCDQSANYTLRILEGKEEIQVPLGKFSISEDEITSPAETFLLNYMQMKELRLIL